MSFYQISLRSRLKRGVVAQVFGQAINIFIQIASVPLFLHFWGVQLYGEWLILFAIPACLAMSDLGFSGVCVREMAMLVAKGDRDSALVVFRSAEFFVILASIIVFFIVILVGFFCPISELLNISEMSSKNVALVIIFLSAQVFLNFQSLLIYGGFYCEGHYGLGQIVLNSIRLFEFLCIAGVIALGFGPVKASAFFVVGRLLGNMVMIKLVRDIAPWLTFGLRGIDKKTIYRLVSPSLSATAFPIGNALNIQGIRIIIGIVMGPAAVTLFSTLRTLSRLSLMILRSVEQLVQPEIGLAYGKGDLKLIREIHQKSCQISLWGSLIAFISLLAFGNWILFIWTGGKVEMDSHIFIMLLFVALINSLWFMSLMVFYSTNRHQKIAITYILMNLATVGLAYGACRIFGLYGVAEMLIIAEVAMTLYVLPKSLNFIEERWTKFIRELMVPPFYLLETFRKNASSLNK